MVVRAGAAPGPVAPDIAQSFRRWILPREVAPACSLLDVRLWMFVLRGEHAAAPPPAQIQLHAWACEEGGVRCCAPDTPFLDLPGKPGRAAQAWMVGPE